MKQGYRYLPWRLKLLWVLGATAAFLCLNYFIVSRVKNNDLFVYSEQTLQIRIHADSVKNLKSKVHSLNIELRSKIDSLSRLQIVIDSMENTKIRLRLELEAVNDSIKKAERKKMNVKKCQRRNN